MSASDDSFFSRWSRRKALVRSGEVVAEPVPPVPAVAVAEPAAVPVASDAPVVETAPPPPTLEDTLALTPASDFSRFVAKGVSPEVRNAAVKKLFADPHFNVMDGLDIYIDDYSKPSPLSAADMAKMVSAQFLKLVDDPEDKNKKPLAAGPAAGPEAAASAISAEPLPATEDTRALDAAEPEETHDDHADLQLQPDHAPGPQGPGPGAG
ncbi:DUF3306 domain-containing protein [Hydrogenophaga sp. A37]|uniref:DUF3306 domain-containing protein n=1 Tax=Hydrogenophaga sp. A37 TaxID=1945864 RepID=UPI0009853F7B|nr:DUF3306 domain-containing protein [Hydrogenophaga sp. A37]OOG81903.1 hypothetical protein B0E41_16510 [Hydrogenophaga sp. A37]